MKNEWRRPQVEMVAFAANEYVAACGDTEYGAYKFICDAGGGVPGDIYLETNGRPGYQHGTLILGLGGDEHLGGYHACGETHEADTTDNFLNGYYVVNGRATDVIVWRGKRGHDIHCTTNLNRDSWEVAKS